MKSNLSFTANVKTEMPVQFYLDCAQLEKFDAVCRLTDRTRSQMLRLAVRAVLVDQGKRAQEAALAELPEFSALTFKEARAFLAPFFDGKPPSEATLERKIECGILVAAKDRGRTNPRRILKASLVAWLRRMGKELTAQFDGLCR